MKEWFSNNSNLILPLFVTSVFSIVNVVFAIINTINARHQKERAQTQICISLMEKRAVIYYAFRDILSITAFNEFKLNDLEVFHINTIDCDFLFGPDINELRNNIRNTSLKIIRVCNLMSGTTNPKHAEWCDQRYELQKELVEIYENLFNYFKDYLDLSEYKIPKK